MATKLEFDLDIEKMCQEIESTNKSPNYKLIIFNDDHHSMGQVVKQLIKAIQCTPGEAMAKMKEAHDTGSAVVKVGPKEELTKAQNILLEIDLATDLVEDI